MGISAQLVRESETIADPYLLKWDWTLPTGSGSFFPPSCSSTSVWCFLDFLALLSHVDFSEAFAEDIVVIQILRKQDPI